MSSANEDIEYDSDPEEAKRSLSMWRRREASDDEEAHEDEIGHASSDDGHLIYSDDKEEEEDSDANGVVKDSDAVSYDWNYVVPLKEADKRDDEEEKKGSEPLSVPTTAGTFYMHDGGLPSHWLRDNKPKQRIHYYPKTMETNQNKNKSPLITNDHSPDISPNVGIVKKIRALLGDNSFKKDKTCSAHNLVEQMEYLYVRVVKARGMALFGRFELFGEVKVGNHEGITKTTSMSNPEWDQVFAFSTDCLKSTTVEIFVKERCKREYMGRVWFDLSKVPRRVPPDSQLEPQWYKMEDKKGDKAKTGNLMLSIWFGTQADEAFSEAWHCNAANVHYDLHCFLKSQVYLSPKLWYLRVSIIEAQDIMPGHRGSDVVRFPEFSAKVQLGDRCVRTKNAAPSATRSFSNPYWNEELFFVVTEPFENDLLVTVEDRVEQGRDMVVARVLLPLATIEKRVDEKLVNPKWFDLDSGFGNACDKTKTNTRFVSRIRLRVSFDGGYNLVDEAAMDNSDVRPSDKRLEKPHIGVLEMGILGAIGLPPMATNHGSGETHAYCVAKYGGKWVRTRTAVDSMSPKWNEQFVWEVYDPCTVVTIGVFHNHRISKNTNNSNATCDYRYGKVRIRLSTLETDRVYRNTYPLLILRRSGLKKMGELQLAVRFSCINVANMLCKYTIPEHPKMHYVHPLSVDQDQLRKLRYDAVNVVASKLNRVEPPLGREVVEYILDHDSSPTWSFRKSLVALFRLTSLGMMVKWFRKIRSWQRPLDSALVLIIFFTLAKVLPAFMVPPAIFFYLAIMGLWNYRYRPQHPPCLDIKLSHAENIHLDELDEEFDTFPTSCHSDVVKMRYDRLRSVAGRLQTLGGDIATVCEKIQSLVSWRDPRATFLVAMFFLLAAVCFCVVPIRLVVALMGLYLMGPPWLRKKFPSSSRIFVNRLPSRVDCLTYDPVEFDRQEIEGLLMTNMVENFQQCIKLFV